MARLEDFKGMEGADFFAEDRGLQVLLGDLLGAEDRATVFASLHECARLVSGRWNELAREANRAENLPRIVKYDRAGNPIEQIDFGPLTRQLRREAAEFGILKEGRSNLHLFALVYLLAHNGEAGLNCGLSCTDGLVRVIEARGSDFLCDTYLPRLRSIETPFAGAQFVTERHERGRVEHGVEQAAELFGRFALGAQGHHEGDELRSRGITRQDRRHRRPGVRCRQVATLDQLDQERGPTAQVVE